MPYSAWSQKKKLESLLAARCSPNLLGSPARAPLSIAVAANDQESVDELLAYRANPNVASDGEEPPLYSAVRHRRRGLSALLQHRADSNIRSLLLLLKGVESRASHYWNWQRAMSAWWICS